MSTTKWPTATASHRPPAASGRPGPLQIAFISLLLTLLAAGAASYSHGSRYALTGHDTPISAPAQPIGVTDTHSEAAPAHPEARTALAQAGHLPDQNTGEKRCCERRPAPRSEPAPLLAWAVNPPDLPPRAPQTGAHAPALPGPELRMSKLITLSVSRT